MKVLLGHNFYRSSAPSGEDSVFRNEKGMLESAHDVLAFERFNDDIDISSFLGKIGIALDGAWSRRTYAELSELVRKTRPDVAHFHNTFPQISPSAYAACRDNGVPVVQTLHNFRFVCPGALLSRERQPCELCLEGSLFSAIRHRCYRDSTTATAAQVWTIASNRWRGTYRNQVDRYIALTSFAAGKLIAGGLPENRMEIKPNFLPVVPEFGLGQGGYAVYVGRLSAEKGLHTLIDAWRSLEGLPLKVIGDGPLRLELTRKVEQLGLPVEFLGFKDRDEIFQIVGAAILQVIPSEWYEGFPMVALEAFACGTPLVAACIGSLDEIVEEDVTGRKFSPGNPFELAAAVEGLLAQPDTLKAMRRNVRNVFLERYTMDSNLKRLIGIYERAICEYRERGSG
jgi:glycosyltransferase involved in cell wall biosynthesis